MSAVSLDDIGQRLAAVEKQLLMLPQILEVSNEHTEMIARLLNALGRVDRKVDAVHRDVLQLRAELVGVIDPEFPAVNQP